MTDNRPPPPEAPRPGAERWPTARRLHRRWPGIVWAIPIAALILVGYLGVRAAFTRGIEVTVTFADGEGVTPGDTKVIENGVEVGHVTKIENMPDGKRVQLTLSMSRRAESALNSNSRFWLIGEQPTITDLRSVRAALAGLIVGLAPGKGGTPQRHFEGLDKAPLVMPSTPGTYYWLDADALGSVQPGATLLYQGQTVGTVTETRLRGFDRFRMRLFVNAPYDAFIRPGALFWRGSPFKVSLTGSGLQTQIASPSTLVQGSVQFKLPRAARANPRAPADTAFALYDDESAAEQGPPGPEVLYDLAVDGAAGDLAEGAPVSLLGYNIGEVRHAQLVFAPGSRRPYTQATIALHPRKLDVAGPQGDDPSMWRGPTDAAVGRLLAGGYRATLSQSIPLVGAHTIAFTKAGGPATLIAGGARPAIPTSAASNDVNALIARINGLPLEQIGANIRQLTGNLARLTGSREVSDSLIHLDATLRQVDGITRQVQPQVGPLMTKLNQTATELQATAAAARGTLGGGGANQDQSLPEAIRQLTEAARSIRSLTDYLGRHPEALLRGKAKESR